jgi:CzcA family heavy metal efflux pump
MLTAFVRFGLRFPGVVVALACVLLGYGAFTLTQARYDVFPDFALPRVTVQTEAPGLAPEQVELLVTHPIENAVSGAHGIDALRSTSIQGLSAVTITFQPSTDVYRNRQVIAERLTALAGGLPAGVRPPTMTPLTSPTSTVLVIGLTSETRSLMDLRTVADWTVRPRLLATAGVASVTVFGGEVRQLQIQAHPDRLILYNIGLDDLLATARRATGIRAAGVLDGTNQRLVLQSEGQSITPAQLAATVVRHVDGANVTVGEIADVVAAPQPPVGAAAIMGQPGVQVEVSAQYGANTLEVTENVEAALADLRPALAAQGITLHGELFRPANFIQTGIANVRSALLLGGVLVVVVLFLFLFNLRTAAISCMAIPLSLLAAVVVLTHLGANLNTMVLGGLAIAIGEVVDDAVIDVENIFRRLRANRRRPKPRPVFDVVLDASIEVRSAVVYATLAVTLVFVPILTMSGVAGRLFGPLGIAYILAVLASLLVALTVTPALSLLLLGRGLVTEREPPLVEWLSGRYVSVLRRIERRPRGVLAGLALLTGLGLAAVPTFGAAFLPELREGHFIVHMFTAPGTSLDESLRLGQSVTAELRRLPFVRAVAQRVGRAELSEDTWGTHYSEVDVDLTPDVPAERAPSEIRAALARFPGVTAAVMTFLSERMFETISGYTAAVAVNVVGNDLDVLDRIGQQVAGVLSHVAGAADVQLQSQPGTPQIGIRLRPDDLARWGFDPIDALDAVRVAYQGEVVGQVYEGNQVFGVAVILEPAARRSIPEVAALPVQNRNGTYVPLRAIADVYAASGRYAVLHQGARRVQTITCNAVGSLSAFLTAARAAIASSVSFPPGTYFEITGAGEAQARARRDLLVHSLIAGAGIVLLLSIVMGHWRNVLLVLLNLPFALVGGVLGVFASGGELSLGSLVGFVTLFGITLRNSIMLISHYEHLVVTEGMLWDAETALRGAGDRLAPILMTALVTAFGLLPMALGSGAPGREIEGPLAMVILGGLVTSTALNLLALPTLALRYGRFEQSATHG